MKCITVRASKSYDVLIGRGLMDSAGAVLGSAVGAERALIVSDSNVAPLYAARVAASLERVGCKSAVYTFPAGEGSKCSARYVHLLEHMASLRLDRGSAVIALGGGVTGDLAGFAAATYLRGIPLVHMPTTVLAAVDSSVGGKTAIDLAAGKNLAGAFCQPDAVICDVDALDSLPADIFADGCAEVVKYGMICDRQLLDALHGPNFDREEIVARCVSIKRDIICRDEFDRGERQLLNFGHTFGHALEKLSGYTLSHGRAVAVGMMLMTCAAQKLGICTQKDVGLLREKLTAFGLPLTAEHTAEQLARAAASDKKRSGDCVTLVVPRRAGECVLNRVGVEKLADYARLGTEA